MRGKLCQHILNQAPLRITPAHAGKTRRLLPDTSFRLDHPRACGENFHPRPGATQHLGSPPRMRGKPLPGRALDIAGRITPAHAGKTRSMTLRTWRAADHPRACGENNENADQARPTYGSPPRMRGKLRGRDGRAAVPRITPAHAGKTQPISCSRAARADHPRACGENEKDVLAYKGKRGSPPRMRGKRVGQHIYRGFERITPAHAGKTASPPGSLCSKSDHPRACGENVTCTPTSIIQKGSPPRMRGKLLLMS